MKISPEWTQEERLHVIAQIAARMQRGINNNEMVTEENIFFAFDHIYGLSAGSAEHLETNRRQILEAAGIEDE